MRHFLVDMYPLWEKLELGVRTVNKPDTPSIWAVHNGQEPWEFLKQNPKRAEDFSLAMKTLDTQGLLN